MQKFYKPLSIFTAVLLVLSLLLTLRYGCIVQEDLSGSVFRLHILANSDRPEDQAQKLRLRDTLLTACRPYFADCTSPAEAIQTAKAHLGEIQAIAEDFLRREGAPSAVSVTVGRSDFPTKTYGGFTLPAGSYNALKVVIGEGQGQNWWCVMYPSLCLLDGSVTAPPEASQTMQENLPAEEYGLISGVQDPEVSLKFKIVELIGRLRSDG